MIVTVIGLMFGDEGKGHTVAKLTELSGATANVRFSGGNQAAHRVVRNGKSHVFSQFCSGSVCPNVVTYLSEQMIWNPLCLIKEAEVHESNGLSNLLDRIFIHPNCATITEYHKALNRALEVHREISEKWRIGTTGLGIGEVWKDVKYSPSIVLKAGDFFDKNILNSKLAIIKTNKGNQVSELCDEAKECYYDNVNFFDEEYLDILLTSIEKIKNNIVPDFDNRLQDTMRTSNVILEGSQGTMIDGFYGTVPYVTKSSVTLEEADKLLQRFNGDRLNIGVIRGYANRHGPGPFPTESTYLSTFIRDEENVWNEWQGNFRVGWIDGAMLHYSVGCNEGLDGIVITNLDRTPDVGKCCIGYEFLEGKGEWEHKSVLKNINKSEIPKFVETCSGLPVYATSHNEDDDWEISFPEFCLAFKRNPLSLDMGTQNIL